MPLLQDEKVVWLNVAVDDVVFVHKSDGLDRLQFQREKSSKKIPARTCSVRKIQEDTPVHKMSVKKFSTTISVRKIQEENPVYKSSVRKCQ